MPSTAKALAARVRVFILVLRSNCVRYSNERTGKNRVSRRLFLQQKPVVNGACQPLRPRVSKRGSMAEKSLPVASISFSTNWSVKRTASSPHWVIRVLPSLAALPGNRPRVFEHQVRQQIRAV